MTAPPRLDPRMVFDGKPLRDEHFCTVVLPTLPPTGHPLPGPEYDDNGATVPPRSLYICAHPIPCPDHPQ